VDTLRRFGERIGVRLPDLRRHPGHCPRTRPIRARPRAPICARVWPRCRCCTRCARPRPRPDCGSLVSHPLVDDAEHAEALALLRSSTALDERAGHRSAVRRTRPGVARRAGRDVPRPRRPGGAHRPGDRPHRLTPAGRGSPSPPACSARSGRRMSASRERLIGFVVCCRRSSPAAPGSYPRVAAPGRRLARTTCGGVARALIGSWLRRRSSAAAPWKLSARRGPGRRLARDHLRWGCASARRVAGSRSDRWFLSGPE